MVLERLHLLIVALVLQLKILGVVSGVGDEFLLIDFVNFLNDTIHEGTVVGNNQKRTRVLLEISLKPHQGIQIQVVCRLVEHEQIGLLDQQAGQVRTHDPPP